MNYRYYGDINFVIYRADGDIVEIYSWLDKSWSSVFNTDDDNKCNESDLKRAYGEIDAGELLLEFL